MSNFSMNMVSSFSIAMFCLVVFWAYWAWKTLSWLWFEPKKLEKRLRQQGFNGNSYRLPFGDLKETAMLMAEANSKPMSFTNEIFPRVLPSLDKTIRNYGKNAFTWKGPQPEVLIMDPELIREIFSKYTVFQRPPRILLSGLATYEKDKWVKHRRLLNPGFHAERLKHMVPAFYLSCSEMLSKWEKLVGAEGSELDVWPFLRTLTADGISRTAFGSNYEQGRKIFELQQEQAELAIQVARSLYNIPGLRYLPTKRNRRMKQIFNQVRSSILGMIDKRIKAIEAGESRNYDLLGIMSMDEIIEECKLFYFAGQETTSTLLVWTMILLGKHLEWQERAREEILQVIGTTEEPDSDKLNQLKIVTMILNEVLRLYPPGVPFGRVIEQDTKLGNITLPAGIQILIPLILLQQDEEMWGKDAKEFNPERFREGISKATKGQFSFFPFGWGPRICIGQNFAMLEAKMALAIILRRYAFELSPSYAHAPQAGTALVPQYGVQLILRKVD
ncbi:PREDICTED: cytochrome P450 CYP72A219-like isoform X3 [Ipomoea nil]|uniref:cytochrome P450 CYP72A219-like isoform X3 n=1 Tax=Ipomoea nil TaxID=35883 RepID=UPI000900A59D|nr:PREDICTED: cytochrome P450 CYP72A219-like isoform X3 [Ipomoea nil]